MASVVHMKMQRHSFLALLATAPLAGLSCEVQGLPIKGFSALFKEMSDYAYAHPGISILSYDNVRQRRVGWVATKQGSEDVTVAVWDMSLSSLKTSISEVSNELERGLWSKLLQTPAGRRTIAYMATSQNLRQHA